MHKICFFVPISHLETVKSALFKAGAGRYENYDHCCWQSLGQGQFRPQPGSDPFIGDQGEVTTIEEYKVEMLCEDALVVQTIAELRAAHPYEEPAFESWLVQIHS